MLIEKYPTRFDFYDHLARLYNWMGKAFKSLEYSKKAYDIAKGTSYEKNSLALNINVFKYKNLNDYQNLELEYKHKWDKSTLILKTISRNDKTGLTLDFSQNLNFYYNFDQYLMNINISHYKGGEYLFRAGIELSNLDFFSDWEISRLNAWFDNKNNGKLSLEITDK